MASRAPECLSGEAIRPASCPREGATKMKNVHIVRATVPDFAMSYARVIGPHPNIVAKAAA